MGARRVMVWLPAVLVGVCGLLVAARAAAGGPIRLFFEIARPLNLESAAAVLVLISLWLRSGRPEAKPGDGGVQTRHWVALGFTLLLTAACYWPSLWFPLVADDYVIVFRALRGELLPRVLTEGDAGTAFRPLTRMLFGVQGWLGRADPTWWQGLGQSMHVANTGLVFLLARTVAPAGGALLAAMVFGLHAMHPEAACWMNSRSDVLAAFFLLGALLLYLSHLDRPRRVTQAAALALVALAIASKESAYAFAPLALLMAAAQRRPMASAVRALTPFLVLEAAMFVWRWQVLGGLGGYTAAGSGESVFLNVGTLSTLKALAWRAWAVLFFPVNWDWRPGPWLGVALAMAAGAMAALTAARLDRRVLACLLGFVAAALVPVLPLALVGVDLAGSRVYYLATVGLALLTGVAWAGLSSRRLRAAVAAALAVFHLTALRHQLGAWESTAKLAERTCREATVLLATDAGRPAVIEGVPAHVDGVFFLSNGLPECMRLNAPGRAPDVVVNVAEPVDRSVPVLRWDAEARRLVRLASGTGGSARENAP